MLCIIYLPLVLRPLHPINAVSAVLRSYVQ